MKNLRILVLAPDLPYPGKAGGQMRMSSIISALAKYGKVHVACIAQKIPEATSEWMKRLDGTVVCFEKKATGCRQLFISRIQMLVTGHNLVRRHDEQEFFDRQFQEFKPDIVWLETPYLLRYAFKWRKFTPVAVDYWGTSEGAERQYKNSKGLNCVWHWLRWRIAFNGERKFAPLADGIVTVSMRDTDFFRRISPDSMIFHVPMGILNTRHVETAGQDSEDSNQTIMTGDMSFEPNVDAVCYFVHEILPRIRKDIPEARFVIAGRSPSLRVCDLAMVPNVEVTGYLPDLSAVIARSAIYVLPMRLGSGVRTKLLEIFLLGKPIVSTTVGVEGFDLENGVNCLIADSPDDFARACTSLLRDSARRRELGESAKRLVAEVYAQDKTEDSVGKVLTALVGQKK